MAEPPELWTFLLANLLVFGFGATLTTLSYHAYRANGRPASFRTSTLGFAVLTIGGIAEPVYQLGIRGDYLITGRELLVLQTIEGAFLAVGLGLLFYSIYSHGSRPRVDRLEHPEQSSGTR